MGQTWKSHDDWKELVLSIYYVGLKGQTQDVRLGWGCLTHWVISQALQVLYHYLNFRES